MNLTNHSVRCDDSDLAARLVTLFIRETFRTPKKANPFDHLFHVCILINEHRRANLKGTDRENQNRAKNIITYVDSGLERYVSFFTPFFTPFLHPLISQPTETPRSLPPRTTRLQSQNSPLKTRQINLLLSVPNLKT